MKHVRAIALLAVVIFVGLVACESTRREKAEATDTAQVTAPVAPKNDSLSLETATFKDVNAVEGSISLVFAISGGEERWFSEWTSEVNSDEFYTSTPNEGSPFPTIEANPTSQGKSYWISYRRVMTDAAENPSGEPQEKLVLVRVALIP